MTPSLAIAITLVLGVITFCAGYAAGWADRHTRLHKDARVLAHLLRHGPSYGLALTEAGLGHQGTIYVRLRRLEAEGLLSAWEEPGGPERGGRPKRMYQLTPTGTAALTLMAACEGGARP